jgi:hypothetical protein
MTAPTFLQILASEVARMQTLHPERLGELARAHALILHGQVLPSADDPSTGQVLSSDGEKRYTVNGVCDCQAGQHGKMCKHRQSWLLYQHILKKMEAQAQPDHDYRTHLETPLYEAPASVNVRLLINGRDCQLTLRDADETRLLARLAVVLQQYPVPEAPVQAASQGQGQDGWCPVHQVQMKWNAGKEGRQGWYSHKVDGQWCKGKE